MSLFGCDRGSWDLAKCRNAVRKRSESVVSAKAYCMRRARQARWHRSMKVPTFTQEGGMCLGCGVDHGVYMLFHEPCVLGLA